VLTNPSKKQASQLICYHIGPQHHMWWVMFQLHCKMQILVSAEQHGLSAVWSSFTVAFDTDLQEVRQVAM